MFYDDWSGLVRVVVVGTCAYLALVALLRISGKRTLAKLNAFDFVITIASNGFRHEAMRQERETADELSQAARAQGHTDLSKVSAIVLETDGALNILTEVPTSLQSPGEDRAGGQRSEEDR